MIFSRSSLHAILAAGLMAALSWSACSGARPNILFISVDDMRDWTSFLGGYEGPVHTPHMERLAERSVNFTNAHCPSPVCNPSRTAVYSGLMPSTTGIYHNVQWLRPHRPEVVTLPLFLKRSGYLVHGAGKSFHHTAGNNPPDQWHEYFRFPWGDIPWMRQNRLNYPWAPDAETPKAFPYSGVKMQGIEEDWGILPIQESEYDDVKVIDYGIDFLSENHDRPFFLSLGTFHPHVPWYVPQRFYDLYDPLAIKTPPAPESDLDDVPPEGQRLAAFRRDSLNSVKDAGQLDESIHFYLASISFADAQIGRLLDALDASPYADNTIIVLWSDHGYHLGEKNHLTKSTLWEESTRVPFMISYPGIPAAGEDCARPVNLIDIFPTLMALADLDFPDPLDGRDLSPLLTNAEAPWPYPSVIEFLKGNAAVRDERWRYIRYHDGEEELYDHRYDPKEWTNLANDPAYQRIKDTLSKWLPNDWAPNAPVKSDFEFDPHDFKWKSKATGATVSGK